MLGYLLTTAALGVGTGLGYSSMAPRSQLFGPTFTGISHGSRQIALTYDDGPNDPHTPRLLEILEKRGVRATFFMIGRYVTLLPGVARGVAQAGHVIGNHTFTHPNLLFCSPRELRAQLEQCRRALAETVGEHSPLFRPPHGGRRPGVLRLARQLGLTPVMWSASGYDWRRESAAAVEARLARQLRGGDVVLLHDGGHAYPGADRSATLAATDNLICRYGDQGYEFVTVPEMMRQAANALPSGR